MGDRKVNAAGHESGGAVSTDPGLGPIVRAGHEFSRNMSSGAYSHRGEALPFPQLDTNVDGSSTQDGAVVASASQSSSQESTDNSLNQEDAQAAGQSQRRGSRFRALANSFSFSRWRRASTARSAVRAGDASEEEHVHPGVAAVEAYIARYGRDPERIAGLMAGIMPQNVMPTAARSGQGNQDMPTILGGRINIIPQVKVVTEKEQVIGVAVELEGVLQNRHYWPDMQIDVVVIIDNGYYVTQECLERATEAAKAAFAHLQGGDGVALYTTHCTHNVVSGNRPERHIQLVDYHPEALAPLNAMANKVCSYGTQAWHPVRPNPSMANAVISVLQSIKQVMRTAQTHVILLSPAAYILHDVSKDFPNLSIHRVNPAILPYRRDPELQDTVCFRKCCKNIFVNGGNSYQSVANRINVILMNARSENPVGEIYNARLEFQVGDGCKLIQVEGLREIPFLRAGEVHTYLLRICVNKDAIPPPDIQSNSSDLNERQRHQDHIASVRGAIKARLLEVRLTYRNTINDAFDEECKANSENIDVESEDGHASKIHKSSTLYIFKELGTLQFTTDSSLEYYKRHYFHMFTGIKSKDAERKAQQVLAKFRDSNPAIMSMVRRMAREVVNHCRTREYENEFRQRLPLCPGPVDLQADHDWVSEIGTEDTAPN